ncbi:hypothetical protein mru_2133 [Methanobrevibacter ruminantium M1]|uniref:Uncharacterized protein n=1 Tax=Methanobrevibacter ruminantium (strain ATCC 35063 / DSM 1093 / JCM 13430 / OCM 146 / M1) TaxID=634498 RepID=D3E109_METRM|nr:hypothetical protein [Methanobrevibacter ruminantium]ADC47983.1 hypothetical protein mru_2133 [Methanobrevibacter ruminantium M1]
MDFVKGIVKKYFRSYNRTLKDGTKKTYKTEQVQVTIPKSDNVFDDKEEVFILSKNQFDEIQDNEELISAMELFNAMQSEDIKNLNYSLDEARQELYSNSSKLESFTLELDDSKLELDKSNKKLLILKEDCSNLRDQLEESKLTIVNLKDQLDNKNFIIEDLNEYVNSLNNKVDSLNGEIDNLNTINAELNDNLNNLTNELNNNELNNGLGNGLNGFNNGNGLNGNGYNNGLDNNGLGNGLNGNGYDNNNLYGYNNGLNINNNHLLSSTVDEDSEVLISDVKSSVSFDYSDYIELQREYIVLLRKYEEAQENLYNEKVKVIHYRSLLEKFKAFIARLE